jgi:putative nucleotidyltransferase with HDIG domain
VSAGEQGTRDALKRYFPIIKEITDQALREKVLDVYCDALEAGGWLPEDMERMPASLLLPAGSVNFVEHTNAVTQTALAMHDAMKRVYGERLQADRDVLLAGGLLHDVGKLLEIARRDATYTRSRSGELLRHPFSGLTLASARGIPDEVLHIIACHSKEGDTTRRTVEAIIIHHADFANFEPFKP